MSTGIIPTLQGRSVGGEVNLNGFPTLAYSKEQHGDFISLASHTRPIRELVQKLKDHGVADFLRETSKALHLTEDELIDVHRWLRDHPNGPL